MPPSTAILRNGTVLTLDDEGSLHDAMAVRGGRVLAVGTEASVRAAAGDDPEVIDLAGRTVVPGFIDAHHHFSHCVVGLLGIDCRGVPSIAEIRDLIARQAATIPKGQWIRGVAYDEHHLVEARHPTRHDLDGVAPDHPVVLAHVSSHQCVANSAALAEAGIDASTPDPPGGLIARDRQRRPIGVLYEVAGEMVDAPARTHVLRGDRHALEEAAVRAAEQQLAFGITQLCDPCVDPAAEDLYLHVHDRLPLRIHALGIGSRAMFVPPDERITPPEQLDGFAISGVKFFADGGDQCAMCLSLRTIARATASAMVRSVRDRSLAGLRLTRQMPVRLDGRMVHTGISFYRHGELDDRVRRTAELDLTVAVHAIGNRAIDNTLDTLTGVRRDVGDHARLRVEHAMFPDPADIGRFADLGVHAVMQPRFVADFGDMFQSTGLDRSLPSVPIRSMLRAGVSVAGSSDAPVTVPSVLAAIGSAVTRTTAAGSRLAEDEALTPIEALRIYTNGSAAALGVAADHGSLVPGKAADLVVLSADPTRVRPDEIADIEITETWVAGERVYSPHSRSR